MKPCSNLQLNTHNFKVVLSLYFKPPILISYWYLLITCKTWTNCGITELITHSREQFWALNLHIRFLRLPLKLPCSWTAASPLLWAQLKEGKAAAFSGDGLLQPAIENPVRHRLHSIPLPLAGTLRPLTDEVNLVRLNNAVHSTAFSHLQFQPCQAFQVRKETLCHLVFIHATKEIALPSPPPPTPITGLWKELQLSG